MEYYILNLSSGEPLFWTKNMQSTTSRIGEAGRFSEDEVIADLDRFDNGRDARAVLVDRLNAFLMGFRSSPSELKAQIEYHRRQIILCKYKIKQLENDHAIH